MRIILPEYRIPVPLIQQIADVALNDDSLKAGATWGQLTGVVTDFGYEQVCS